MKNNLFFGFPLKVVTKVAFAGIFIALACIFNKVVAINYIPIVPFVRISFGGPAIIIFASFLLGPIYGALIGGFSDILGYLIFDIKAYPYFPSITLTYVLLGFLAGVLFFLAPKIKNIKLSRIIIYISFTIIYLLVTLYVTLNSTITLFNNVLTIELWMKIVIPLVSLLLFIGLVIFIELTNKKMKNKDLGMNVFSVALMMFILELLVMTLFGSLMKAIAFGLDAFLVIFIFQLGALFFNIPFNVVVFYVILSQAKKYIVS